MRAKRAGQSSPVRPALNRREAAAQLHNKLDLMELSDTAKAVTVVFSFMEKSERKIKMDFICENLLTAMIVVDYYPRLNFTNLTEDEKNAFMVVYNKFVDELVERGVLEC